MTSVVLFQEEARNLVCFQDLLDSEFTASNDSLSENAATKASLVSRVIILFYKNEKL